MKIFDPKTEVLGSELILENGAWPNFHDAQLERVQFWRGDVQPEIERWIGPQVAVQFYLEALEQPRRVALKFIDCEFLSAPRLDGGSALLDLTFSFDARGFLNDGNPLTPWIVVQFEATHGALMRLKCLQVSVLPAANDLPQSS